MSDWNIQKKNNDLIHYGILGMKWGVRRYQNKDGTLTSAGKRRYYSDYIKVNTKYGAKTNGEPAKFIRSTISKNDVKDVAIQSKKLTDISEKYKNEIKKLGPDVYNAWYNGSELVDSIIDNDKKYSEEYRKIINEAHNKAIEYSREFFTKEENQKMTDNDIEKTRYYNKIFDSLCYDDSEFSSKIEQLQKQVKNDDRFKTVSKIQKERDKIVDDYIKSSEKVVNDLIGNLGNFSERYRLSEDIKAYTDELLENDKDFFMYIENFINKGD